MLFAGNQRIYRDAEHPCRKSAFLAEGRKACHYLQKDILHGILRIGECAQHAQRKAEYLPLYACKQFFHCGFVPGGGSVDQSENQFIFIRVVFHSFDLLI